MRNKNVFISYSWDSNEHQEWVLYLANQLRKKGINAEADIFETQKGTVNLNKMMVEKIRNSDFIVIVLTEGYARKADQFQGGVGFESQLTLPLLMEDHNKLITIMRHQGDYNKVFPFHLKGQYSIDFSNDTEFNNKLDELVYRIYGKKRYYVEPIGEMPKFALKIPSRNPDGQANGTDKAIPMNADFSDLNLSKLKPITDREIDLFLKDSFKQIINLFFSLFTEVKAINPGFDFDQDNLDNHKTLFKLYVDGKSVNAIKVWYGNSFGGNTINLSYGNYLSMSDNSMNEILTHYIDDQNELKLKMSMNSFGNRNATTPDEIVKEIWKNNIVHTIQ